MKSKRVNIKDIIISYNYEAKNFSEYFHFNLQGLENRNDKINNTLEIEINEGLDNEHLIRKVYEEDFIKFPSYFYRSSIVMIYSLLESVLFDICEKVKCDLSLKISVKDFNTNETLGKSITYLEKIVDLEFYKEEKLWNRLNDFRSLRNNIVHQNSKINIKSLEKEKELINRLKYIKLDLIDYTFYIVDSKLITDFLDLVNEFLSNIFSQIELKEFILMEIIQLKSPDLLDLPF